MSPEHRMFLTRLAAKKQGRLGVNNEIRDQCVALVQPLIDDGYLIERPYGFGPGFQITEAGRAYLGGEA